MTSERDRGVLLYGLFAVLLIGGGLWFHQSAPAGGDDHRVRAWRDNAATLLPDRPFQVRADTIVLSNDSSTEHSEPVGGGAYTLSMICLGDRGRIRVRLSSSGDDSGRAVPCSAAPQTVSLTVGLADQFFMEISAETDGRIAVFRWRLDHGPGF